MHIEIGSKGREIFVGYGLNGCNFQHELNSSPVIFDRKVLTNMASHEPFSLRAVVDVVKNFAVSRASF
jgi:ribosomal protein L20